uniref:Uncharacterized protein AlNc14C1537G12983 n=1 Tax=Albugo laibachii Nc14 TaxID=890382 RepID=F0X2R4_9STRA|nr:conserved hypothetical protein [Albugo laibachii Nc14]|eukprot:CCA28205.1 conserved hypothetical protein [Albugo laibachii Nc14]
MESFSTNRNSYLMERVLEGVKRQIRGQYGHLMLRWYEAVDWKEPLIIGTILSHMTLLILIYITRKQYPFQVVWFIAIIALLMMSERINTWGQQNWKLIATQNYFDSRGVFIGIFYAAPLLFIGFVQTTLNMKRMVDLMVEIKQIQVEKQQLRKEMKKD